ncbi:MAG: SAM-dependent chlorinase/fluorinase [Bacteroidetes bacterium]|nr:SAM-dependent chlorinase/fluorinase [Bacteroidota bacterium]MCL5737530.1 SAM-dependent chlorinase/fluorinase [Bacteroidota bacterium]
MPLIVLLTDFGSRDYFVGVMKGVIAGINPVARVIDLTHEIEPQNISQAAFILWASRKFFPEDAIFVNVIDPGVGSERKIICGRIDGQIFLAPDNGLLDYVVADGNEINFYEVSNKKFFLKNVSTTFHGRDIFAPVSAYLSRGNRLNEFGEPFRYQKVKPFYSTIARGRNEGKIVYQDRFGNVFTSFLWNDVLLSENSRLKISSKVITKFYLSYSASKGKSLIGVKGSSGLLEVAVNLGNAAKFLKSAIGQKITLISK